eukprot:674734-Pyramimonas_sp.AAC.1
MAIVVSPYHLPQSRARGRVVGFSPVQFVQVANARQGHEVFTFSAVPESGMRGKAMETDWTFI